MTTSTPIDPSATAQQPEICPWLVRATDVCVHYGSTVALAPTSFEFRSGESIALVGANGSGKTSLLSLIAGLIEPEDGELVVDGTVALVAQHRDHHGWMPLSVDEVLRMGRYRRRGLTGRLNRADRDIIDESAERLAVADLRRRAFGDLSGGQQQRVLVARALIARPDVLLLDEPITGLDLPSQATILNVIDEHVASGGTAVFSTHHLAEARRAHRVVLLAGCVLADGTPGEVLQPDLLGEAFGERVLSGDEATVVIDTHGRVTDPEGGLEDLAVHHVLHRDDHEHDHRGAGRVERHPHHHRAAAAVEGCDD